MSTIRTAVQSDGKGIGDVHAESWRVAYEGLFAPDVLEGAVERRRQMWTGAGAAFAFANGTLLVAEESGRIAGFIHFGPAEADAQVGEVYGFYLHPTSWGTGIAQDLMDEAVTSLAEHFASAILWTNAEAGGARRFYSKSGWSETGAARQESLWDGLVYPAVEYGRPLYHR